MGEQTLAKATGHGFTVLPNRVIDFLLSGSAKHTSDSLALAIYVVRHIPSQIGSLALSGDFSQPTVCEDLGWGSTNRARLKRALAHLSAAGILTAELRDNNTIVLHISAALNVGTQAGRESQAVGKGWKDSLQGGARFSPPGGQQKSSQASRAPASLHSKFNHENKNLELNNLHHPEASTEDRAQARASLPKDDDDVRKLLGIYTSDLKKPLTRNAANAFAETYALNGRPYELVESALRTLARHPLLLKNTISPNAVWELGYMQKQAHTFDARVRGHLREVSRGGNADFTLEFQRIAEAHGCDRNMIAAYFQVDVDNLLSENAKWANHDFHGASASEEATHANVTEPPPDLALTPTIPPARQLTGKSVLSDSAQPAFGASPDDGTLCLLDEETTKKPSSFHHDETEASQSQKLNDSECAVEAIAEPFAGTAQDGRQVVNTPQIAPTTAKHHLAIASAEESATFEPESWIKHSEASQNTLAKRETSKHDAACNRHASIEPPPSPLALRKGCSNLYHEHVEKLDPIDSLPELVGAIQHALEGAPLDGRESWQLLLKFTASKALTFDHLKKLYYAQMRRVATARAA